MRAFLSLRWLIAAVGLLVACGGDPASTPEEASPKSVSQGSSSTAKPPIVLIVIDTLRSDHLSIYGYEAGETPAIDALAQDGVVYEHAYTHAPLTLPAHASLFSGQLSSEHNVRDNIGYLYDAEQVPPLALYLKGKGYATGGAISAFVLRGATGLSSGFDFYDDTIESRRGVGLGGLQRSGRDTWRRLRPWLDDVVERPVFLFLHLYDPHSPYDPPAPFDQRFASPYDGEIAAADAVVGDVVAALKQLALYEIALIVLLSDHGEGLGDHGEEEHGVLLYREVLQVPLVIKWPGNERRGQRVAANAQLIDIFPTVAALFGEQKSELPGLPLQDLAAAERQIYAETFYPRLHFGWSDLASLIVGRDHYIEGPRPELFDLLDDPAEKNNLLSQERRRYAELRQVLTTFDRTLQAPSQVDEETQRKLAALGYVGSAAPVGDGPLPDPKDHLNVLGDLRLAMAALNDDDHALAESRFTAVVEQNPRLLDAWEGLAQARLRQGRSAEALEAYREALKISGGAPHLALPAGFLWLELGQLDEAAEHAQLALETAPSEARDLLARVALRRGDLDEAEKLAREALESSHISVAPLVTLGQVLTRKDQPEEALEVVERALDQLTELDVQDPDRVRGLHFLHGTIQARLGRPEQAERAFREQIRLFPDFLGAYSELAVLLALVGRGDEVGPLLRQMTEANPTPVAYAAAVRTLRVLEDPQSAAALLGYARNLFPNAEEFRSL